MAAQLSPAQQKTVLDIEQAPEYNMGCHQWCDTYLIRDHRDRVIGVNGNWNSTTLQALERKGVIDIVKDGGFWNDIVLLRG